jgi:hypothetical protein
MVGNIMKEREYTSVNFFRNSSIAGLSTAIGLFFLIDALKYSNDSTQSKGMSLLEFLVGLLLNIQGLGALYKYTKIRKREKETQKIGETIEAARKTIDKFLKQNEYEHFSNEAIRKIIIAIKNNTPIDSFTKENSNVFNANIGPQKINLLHVAVIYEANRSLRYLLERGKIDTTACDQHGLTPFDYALHLSHEVILDTLRAYPSHQGILPCSMKYFSTRNQGTFLNRNNNAYNELKENSRDMILGATKGILQKNAVLIFGAGYCIELPLRELAERFDKVILVDVDKKAMQTAIDLLSDELKKKCTCIEYDLTGIFSNFSIELMHLERRTLNAHEIQEKINILLNKYALLAETQTGRIAAIFKEKYHPSFVISSLLISTLGPVFVDEITRVFPKLTKDPLLESILSLSVNIQKGHLLLLRNVCSHQKMRIYFATTSHLINYDNPSQKNMMLSAELIEALGKIADHRKSMWPIKPYGYQILHAILTQRKLKALISHKNKKPSRYNLQYKKLF